MGLRIIRDNVEARMIETINLCQKMNVPLRCIHLATAPYASGIKPETWQSTMLQAIEDSLSDDDGEGIVYLCADGDFMIVTRRTARKSFLRLLDLIPRNLVPDPGLPGLARFFELNIEGEIMRGICQGKIAATRAREIERLQKEQEQVIAAEKKRDQTIELDIQLNAPLIASLSARRRERKSPCILVVEDDLFSQRLVTGALRSSYEVCAAHTGREALMAMIRHAPDMIFLDIELPDITGLAILDTLLEIDPHAHIVMLSGNGSRDNILRAMQKGAKGFIGKPFTLEKLQQAIGGCLFIKDKQKIAWETNHAG